MANRGRNRAPVMDERGRLAEENDRLESENISILKQMDHLKTNIRCLKELTRQHKCSGCCCYKVHRSRDVDQTLGLNTGSAVLPSAHSRHQTDSLRAMTVALNAPTHPLIVSTESPGAAYFGPRQETDERDPFAEDHQSIALNTDPLNIQRRTPPSAGHGNAPAGTMLSLSAISSPDLGDLFDFPFQQLGNELAEQEGQPPAGIQAFDFENTIDMDFDKYFP